MAKIRSHVVSRASCAVIARELGLDAQLLERAPDLPQDDAQNLAKNRNVLAALLEAALAALFLEHGFHEVERIRVEILLERRLLGDLRLVDAQLLDEHLLDAVEDLFARRCHVTSICVGC